jgi:hypothetical protein
MTSRRGQQVNGPAATVTRGRGAPWRHVRHHHPQQQRNRRGPGVFKDMPGQ